MPKAPPFTRENAAMMAARSNAAQRAAREELARARVDLSRVTTEDARKAMTLAQLDKLDGMINRALDDSDEERFLKLSAAKERLWKLVQPTAGSLRPGRQQRQQQRPLAEPIPQEPTQPTPIQPT